MGGILVSLGLVEDADQRSLDLVWVSWPVWHEGQLSSVDFGNLIEAERRSFDLRSSRNLELLWTLLVFRLQVHRHLLRRIHSNLQATAGAEPSPGSAGKGVEPSARDGEEAQKCRLLLGSIYNCLADPDSEIAKALTKNGLQDKLSFAKTLADCTLLSNYSSVLHDHDVDPAKFNSLSLS